MGCGTARRWVPTALWVLAGTFLVGVGLLLLAAPESGGRFFGAGTADGEDGFARSTGIRQVYLGALVLVASWTGRDRGLFLMSLAVIPLSDSVIWLTAGSGVGKALEHLIGLLTIPIGAYIANADRGRGDPSWSEGRASS
jgi:Domain of unknown function (DUF4267)